jgi:hypothetical protein
MIIQTFRDNGGRRTEDRRYYLHLGPVLEKRRGKDRRTGFERRQVRDPVVRIVGDERRKSLRNLYPF